jgi:3-phenylpropionate/trans-cinnamate dioxygenase ferredoxin component
MPTTTEFRTIGDAADLDQGTVNPYYLEDLKQRVGVARVGDGLYAFDELCTCAANSCPLSAGLLAGTTLMCQCHGSSYDVTTGAVLQGPATRSLTSYDVQEVDGRIQIRV